MKIESMKAVYQILKAIDISYENEDFDYKTTFDLEKLKISEHRLNLILENLLNSRYIQGLGISISASGFVSISINSPRLTLSGINYLEMDSTMQKIRVELTNPEEIAPELKEIASSLSGLDEGQQEVVKLLASHVEVLDEIRFLEADKMTIMKEKLIKLREEDKGKKIPWDSVISLVTTIGSNLI